MFNYSPLKRKFFFRMELLIYFHGPGITGSQRELRFPSPYKSSDLQDSTQAQETVWWNGKPQRQESLKLEINPNVQPVAQQPRRIPHSMKKSNAKLQGVREQATIERVEGATPWLTPLIAIPKKAGDLGA